MTLDIGRQTLDSLTAGDIAGTEFRRRAGRIGERNKLHSQIREQTLKGLRFLRVQVPFGLSFEHSQNINPMLRSFQVDAGFSGNRMRHHSKIRSGVRSQRHDQAEKARRIIQGISGSRPGFTLARRRLGLLRFRLQCIRGLTISWRRRLLGWRFRRLRRLGNLRCRSSDRKVVARRVDASPRRWLRYGQPSAGNADVLVRIFRRKKCAPPDRGLATAHRGEPWLTVSAQLNSRLRRQMLRRSLNISRKTKACRKGRAFPQCAAAKPRVCSCSNADANVRCRQKR